MKKKIKDLTLAEAKELCYAQPKLNDGGVLRHQCSKCKYVNCLGGCKLDFYYIDEYGEEEVEIDD